MQAIKTKFVGPNNVRGSRMTATCQAGRTSVEYDHGLDDEGNHRRACEALRAKMRWVGLGPMVGGSHGDDWYWVFLHPLSPRTGE